MGFRRRSAERDYGVTSWAVGKNGGGGEKAEKLTYCQGRRIGDSGVRRFPGAAMPDGTETYWFSKAFWHSLVAAPEDGRTPAWSCIPASHQYAINSINSPPSCPAHGSLTPTGPSPGGN